jgi:hypothetical protein
VFPTSGRAPSAPPSASASRPARSATGPCTRARNGTAPLAASSSVAKPTPSTRTGGIRVRHPEQPGADRQSARQRHRAEAVPAPKPAPSTRTGGIRVRIPTGPAPSGNRPESVGAMRYFLYSASDFRYTRCVDGFARLFSCVQRG